MSKESNEEKLSRVREMASGSETWDLSRNDLAALKYVLSLVDGASRPAPVEVRGVVTPPSEEDWRGVMREHEKPGRFGACNEDGVECDCGADSHNARLAALRARVEAERERTRRVAAAAVAYVSAPDESDELPDMYAALRAAVRALRGEP